MSTIRNDPFDKSIESRKQFPSDPHKTSLTKQGTPSFGATFEAKLQQRSLNEKATVNIQTKEEKETDHGASQDPTSLNEITSLGVSTAGIHKVVQKSNSKSYSTSVKNLNNGQKKSDQPQLNTYCIVKANGEDSSARGNTRKQQTLTQNPEQPSKITRQAQTGNGLVDKKKVIKADVMDKVQTERIKRSSNTPSISKKGGSEKNLPIDRPKKNLSATFAQKADPKPITRKDQKGVKTFKNALASAFNLTAASNQKVSRNHGTPRASVSLNTEAIAKNVETEIDQPDECDIMKNSNQTLSNLASKKASPWGTQSMLDAKNFSSDSQQLKVNPMVNHTIRDTPITLGETSLQAHSQPRVEPSVATAYSQSNLQAVQRLQSLIHDHVTILRAGGQQSLQVTIRPESGIAMMLTLQQVENQVLVAAKMDESTANLLKPQWQELQRELESQGIKLNQQEIGDNSHTKNQGKPSGNQTPNFKLEEPFNDQQSKKIGIEESSSSQFTTNHDEEHEGALLSYA